LKFDKNIKLLVDAEPPNQELYKFEGSLNINDDKDGAKPADSKQLLLRGAFLRNTEWILGIVVYTGMDTKIMKNAEAGKAKTSDMNK